MMLRICDHPDCATLTLGTFCVSHEPHVTVRFPRGRPFPPRQSRALPGNAAAGTFVADPVQLTVAGAVSLGGGTAL